jgi:hypothetical protein
MGRPSAYGSCESGIGSNSQLLYCRHLGQVPKFAIRGFQFTPIRSDRILRCRATSLTPTPEQQIVVLVDEATLRAAERLIESCEHSNEEGAEIPFDWILDRITGSKGSVTDRILEAPAKCPNCRHKILEKTLVEPA